MPNKRNKLFDNSWSGLWEPDYENKASALGITYFYYPKNLSKSFNQLNIITDRNPEYLYYLRVQECNNSLYIKRDIPYCEECMLQYVNFGERKDGMIVPFGRENGHAYNI